MDSRKWNLNALVVIALVAGLIQAAAGVVMYFSGFYFSPWSMLVTSIVMLLCIVLGTKVYRDKYTTEKFTYGQAFITGAAIGIGTGVVYAIYNLISINFFYPHFLDEVARTYAATGAFSFETIRASLSPMVIAVPNLLRLSVGGIVLSALVALFLKRREPGDDALADAIV
ncbi:MAG: DUF4199 domain-containing protein [Acidobacteriota bacterium]